MRKYPFALLVSLFFATFSIGALASEIPFADDSDLSPNLAPMVHIESSVVSPDSVVTSPLRDPRAFELTLTRRTSRFGDLPISGLSVQGDGINAVTDAQGSLSGTCAPGKTSIRITARFATAGFQVTDGNRVYGFNTDLACGQRSDALIEETTSAGHLFGIFQVAHTAHEKTKSLVDMSFWESPVTFVFPADADYYNWGTVHISKGYQWDVVGHELGHAIYHLANVGRFGGGSHKIDECYSGALALSEGWASYFSAWISLRLDDSDAKFQYMVPRRAPIQVENVPADVCEGPTSEWRVGSYFWDVIDTHDDAEALDENFARVWNALLNSNSADVTSAHRRLLAAGIDRDRLFVAWMLNFRKPL